MSNNITGPRVIRDRLSVGKALAVQLVLCTAFWVLVAYLVLR